MQKNESNVKQSIFLFLLLSRFSSFHVHHYLFLLRSSYLLSSFLLHTLFLCAVLGAICPFYSKINSGEFLFLS